MKVRIFGVSVDDPDVSFTDHEFESQDKLWEYIDKEYGEEDVQGEEIRDQYGDDVIIIEGDVWFTKIEILD